MIGKYNSYQVDRMANISRWLIYEGALMNLAASQPDSDVTLKNRAPVAKALLEKIIPDYLEIVPECERGVTGSNESIENLRGLCKRALGL